MEQIGIALTFKVGYKASKQGKTNLTVTVDVFRNGSIIITAASASEQADGLYYYTMASSWNTVAGLYEAVFKTTDTSVDDQWLNTQWIVGTGWLQHINADTDSRAPASTALDNTIWTNTKAGYLSHDLADLDTEIDALATSVGALPTASSIATAVWSYLKASATTVNSFGKAFYDWLVTLGTDSKVILSANAQTGVTIPSVTTVGTVNALAVDSVSASALATDAVNEIASAIDSQLDDEFAALTSALDTHDTDIKALLDTIDNEISALPTPPSASAIALQVEAQLADDFSAIGGSITSAADIWEYLDTNALPDDSFGALLKHNLDAQVSLITAAVKGKLSGKLEDNALYATRGDTWLLVIEGLGDVSGRVDACLSIKSTLAATDDEALVRISELGGLEIFKGATNDDTLGTFVFTDTALGNAVITLQAELAAQIQDKVAYWDAQIMLPGDPPIVVTPLMGKLYQVYDVTQRTAPPA